ncbi:MAG: hypothetical protein H6672_08435 [Anaerolineaceae bacterium]|nr:hypothetical protein [Anaerolineaceae bacterium]
MEHNERATYEVAVERLHQFEHLSELIQDSWLRKQHSKSVEQYSLITGWLTTSADDWKWTYSKYTKLLDSAINALKQIKDRNLWNKLSSKIRAPSNRAESKSVLAEIALALFLIDYGIPFGMETKLDPTSSKDVDFWLKLGNSEDVYVEMQCLTESDASQRTSRVSAMHGGIPIRITDKDFEDEGDRILGKIFDKTPKLVEDKITFVGLDCTAIPEHGGIGLGTIPDALSRVFGQDNLELTESGKKVRQLVDGVIWFQIDFDNALRPVKRGYFLNEHSAHFCKPGLVRWIELWTNSNLQECEAE